jgi:hypothetical protein
MAIAQKNRRRIVVAGRTFFWGVYQDVERFGVMTLAVVAADKRFIVQYVVDQPGDKRYLHVMGPEFPGLPLKHRQCFVLCPILISAPAVTPSEVRRLIEWSLHAKRDVVAVSPDAVQKEWTRERAKRT